MSTFALEWQVTVIAAATCPACRRISERVENLQFAMPTGDLAIAPFCVCPNGHAWPSITVGIED